MKRIVFVLMLALPAMLQAQKITKSEVNGFTDERTIETSIVTLKQGFTTGFGVQYRQVHNNIYLSFIGYGKNNTAITDEDLLQFILNDGTVIKFNSRVELPYADADVPNVYIHHFYISKKDVEALKNNHIVIVRVISPATQLDIPVSKKNSLELSKLSELFLNEVNK